MKNFRNAIWWSLFVVGACNPEVLPDPNLRTVSDLPQQQAPFGDDVVNAKQAVELGRLLFWDPILSGNREVACVTCHHPRHGYVDGLALGSGVGGRGLGPKRKGGTVLSRNAQTIVNTAFNGMVESKAYDPVAAAMFWDNRIRSLEEQALEPILSAEEMRGEAYSEEAALDSVVARLESVKAYRDMFNAAFGTEVISADLLVSALAAFERSIVSTDSRFDQYARGDQTALSELEIRGLQAFSEAGCIDCHSGPMFSDFKVHVLSVPEHAGVTVPDDGDGTFAFRTPSLRNLSLTGPYMHNGIFRSLEQVLEFYDDVQEGSQNPFVSGNNLDKEILDLEFNDIQTNAILAFLQSLEDHAFDQTEPESVPSGLRVGGL
ncbi:MAG: cytochrome-c peroxidase [Saprospiraceae bacterium]|nr:cytochrome-c peroxidase [Saprospiraceae bacterium]